MSVAPTTNYITVAAATGAVSINVEQLFSRYVIETSGVVTLSANLSFNVTGSPFDGQTICFDLPGTIVLSTFTFQIFGTTVTADQALVRGRMYLRFNGGVGSWFQILEPNFSQTGWLTGATLKDGSTPVDKLETGVTSGIIRITGSTFATYQEPTVSNYMMIGDGTDVVALASDATNGDVTPSIVSGAIRWLIGAGKILNAHIGAAAAIARTKLASGSANHVVINDGSGVMSSEAALAVSRGGTGANNSAATGLQKYAAGTPSVGLLVAADVTADTLTPSTLTQEARTEVITLQVSFETGFIGDFKIKLGYSGTVTEIYSYATKVIAGTDNGTIVPKDNSGTTMTDGTITYTASDARGTAYTSTPTANNTFVAGDVLTFTTAKATAGGVIQLSITIERSN
jgi:hypothetical protein